MVLKNKYFLLRHGRNNHQAEKPDVTYFYPDNEPPCFLIDEGVKEVQKAGEFLKERGIDLIFSSDVLRTRQTAKIVADMIGLNEIVYDLRLRDVNWGAFAGKNKKEAWGFFNNDGMKRFETAAPQGESWNQCLERVVSVLNEIEGSFQDKKVLIVSHGDPLWLLEGYVKGLTKEELARERNEKGTLNTGEVREL